MSIIDIPNWRMISTLFSLKVEMLFDYLFSTGFQAK
jgi:hypothetical protein